MPSTPVHDVVCRVCGAKQLVPAQGVPFRYRCGNPECGALNTWHGPQDNQINAGTVSYFPRRPRRLA